MIWFSPFVIIMVIFFIIGMNPSNDLPAQPSQEIGVVEPEIKKAIIKMGPLREYIFETETRKLFVKVGDEWLRLKY